MVKGVGLLVYILAVLVYSAVFSGSASGGIGRVLLVAGLNEGGVVFTGVVMKAIVPLYALVLFRLLGTNVFSLVCSADK